MAPILPGNWNLMLGTQDQCEITADSLLLLDRPGITKIIGKPKLPALNSIPYRMFSKPMIRKGVVQYFLGNESNPMQGKKLQQ